MKSKVLIIFLLAFIATGQSVLAQFESILPQNRYKSSVIWDLSFDHGLLLVNKDKAGNPITNEDSFNGFNFKLGFRKNNLADLYNKLYRLPIFGLGYSYSSFQDDLIGNPNALYFYYSIPVAFEENKRFTLAYNGSFGMSYNKNMDGMIRDGSALLLGAYGNSYLQAGLAVDYHPNPFWVIYSTVGIKHFANGSATQPESGLTMFPVTLGIKYKPTGFFTEKRDQKLPTFVRHNETNFMISASSKNYNPGEASYLKSSMGFNWLRMFNYKIRAGFGADVFYSDKTGLRDSTGTATLSNSISYAINGTAEWVLTRHLFIPITVGYYIHRNEANGETEPYYERVGIKYRIGNHFFAGLNLKAHGIEPDIFEWSLGYTFHRDQNRY